MTLPAIAYTGEGIDISSTADADLSSSQFKIVKKTSTGVALCSGTTDKPFGVLQNTPKSGEGALVRVFGPSKVVSGGSITQGANVGTTAGAVAQTAVSTQYPVGIALAGAASGDTFTIHVMTGYIALP
jgi:hypothetical protein